MENEDRKYNKVSNYILTFNTFKFRTNLAYNLVSKTYISNLFSNPARLLYIPMRII